MGDCKILIIGDPHLRTDCLDICELFCNQIKKIVDENIFNFVVVLGDVLHNHEKINTVALNMAVDLFKYVSQQYKLFVIVGNHDYINNSQFLTSNHWMNCLNGYNNIYVIDKVMTYADSNKQFMFCPYVPNGRLIEALNTVEIWKSMDIIFAHQEIRSSILNSNGRISTTGDSWYKDYPLLISGHIHHKQKNENVIYPGSSLPTSFSDSDQKYVLIFTLHENNSYNEDYIQLNIPLKITKHISLNDIDTNLETIDKNTRLIIEGDQNSFDEIKTQSKLKQLQSRGINIVKRVKESTESRVCISDNNFNKQLKQLIEKEINSGDLIKIWNKCM